MNQILHLVRDKPTLTYDFPLVQRNFATAATRRHAFGIACSIAAFARGTGPDPVLAKREIDLQRAFAAGHKFVVEESIEDPALRPAADPSEAGDEREEVDG